MAAAKRVVPRGLGFLKSLAVAAVYATHMHYVPFNFHTQAKSAVSHFFIHSGLLAYLSLLSPLSKSSLGSGYDKGRLRTAGRFCARDLWIIWLVFILKRCLVLGLYCHIYRILIIKHSPEYVDQGAEWRILTHLWAHWWNYPHYRLIKASEHLWFLSDLALYWVFTTPIAALLYVIPDGIALLSILGFTIWTIFAIQLMPHTNDWNIYYFSPQTHWVPYLLGVCLWRARDCSMTNKFFDKDLFHRRNIWTWCLFPLAIETLSYVFIWWQKHIILHPIRPENDFVDTLYRTTTYMAVIIFLWSTPIADHSPVVRLASARFWDRVAPGGVNLAIFVVQWNLSQIINGGLRGLSGRVFTLLLTYYASVWSEAFIMGPLRNFFTPYFNEIQKFATSSRNIEAKDSSLPVFDFKTVESASAYVSQSDKIRPSAS